MKNRKDIGKILLYVVLGILIIVLARNSVNFAASMRYMLRPYNMIPNELYELEDWIESGNYGNLIKDVRRNAVLKEKPMSDTSEHEALARYIEAAFDYHAMMENGKTEEAAQYYADIQKELEQITSYRFQEIVEAVQEIYEVK